jgi:hypothetical protein
MLSGRAQRALNFPLIHDENARLSAAFPRLRQWL